MNLWAGFIYLAYTRISWGSSDEKMGVKFIIPKYLQNKTNGESTTEVKGSTLRECVEALTRQYPSLKGEILDDEGAILLKWLISINNKMAPSSDELSHQIEDGDEIMLVPVADGG